MKLLLDLFYLLAGAALSPMVIYRTIRHKRYRTGWRHRFGQIRRTDRDKKCLWLHAVSVGEVNASQTLLSEFQVRLPDYEIVVSTTTDTGFARARELYGDRFEVFHFPLDLSGIVKRAFDRLRPSLCLLMELEVWPNFVQTAFRLGVPVVVVNGRISDRSFRTYRKVRPFLAGTFRKITLTLAQTEQYAERFRTMGCPADRVVVTGSMKFDTAQVTDRVDGTDLLASQLGLGRRPLWVAGGTGDEEEKPLLEVYLRLKADPRTADLQWVVVPRKPERFDQVAQWIQDAGLPLVRYSRIKNGTESRPIPDQAVILGDTMGDLRKFYSLATVVFVGRSLVPMGGSDMMEAAALGKPTLFGPHTFNFRQSVELLLHAQGGIQVEDPNQLRQALERCLLETDLACRIARNGRKVILENQGATTKTIDQVLRLLQSA